MWKLFFSLLILFLLSCSEQKQEENKIVDHSTELISVKEPTIDRSKKVLDTILLKQLNLVDVQEINPAIFVDLKYTGTDNFMKMKLYEKIDRAYLLKEVAQRLGKVQETLSKIDPSLHLLIYDAVRPVSVQEKMWRALDSIPPKRRGLFVSNPKNGSVHNYGAAVDLTLCDGNGKALDMGAGFDDIREIAYPSKEQLYLEKGLLTQQQIDNRKLLRKVMSSHGFVNIPSEWWHFNGISRAKLKTDYQQLLTEF